LNPVILSAQTNNIHPLPFTFRYMPAFLLYSVWHEHVSRAAGDWISSAKSAEEIVRVRLWLKTLCALRAASAAGGDYSDPQIPVPEFLN